MAEKEQIDFVFDSIMKDQPQALFKLYSDSNTGIGAVLRLLKVLPEPVTAGKISEMMGVSEARVTALLKKMINRGYITKEKDERDALVAIVKLTLEGIAMADGLRDTLRQNIAAVIDAVGMEKLTLYVQLTEEINGAMKSQLPPPPLIT